jgi:hypothetical protein
MVKDWIKGLELHEQVFADGLGQIAVIGQTVRLDFVSYSPVEKDTNGRPVAVFRQQVIMTIEGFTQAAEKMHEAAEAISSRVANLRPREPLSVVEPVAVPPAVAGPPANVSVPEPILPAAPKIVSKPPFP